MNNFHKELWYDSQMLLTDQLIEMEGYKQFPYKDIFGYETIGIGRNLKTKGISRDEAIFLLNNDIKESICELQKNISFFNDLGQSTKCVLINMCFNMGIDNLMKFRDMLSALAAGDLKKASEEMLDSLWAKEVPNRANALALIMEKGLALM